MVILVHLMILLTLAISDEFVNLAIVVILLNLVLVLIFSGESVDFGKFYYSGNLDQYG